MIDHNILVVPTPDRITFDLFLIAEPETQKANDDIVSTDKNGIVLDRNTISWRCLTGNCNIRLSDAKGIGEFNRTRNFENDNTFTRSTHCGTKASRT